MNDDVPRGGDIVSRVAFDAVFLLAYRICGTLSRVVLLQATHRPHLFLPPDDDRSSA